MWISTVLAAVIISATGTSTTASSSDETLVVTGTRTRRGLSDTPVKTEVIEGEQILDRGASNLIEALEFETGLRIDNVCSICNTTGIRMSGVPSRYSLVLVDGMPVYSSLGGVYGLLNIPAASIAQVEVVKGGSSVLYGTDAIGGVINVRTRAPSAEPRAMVRAEGGTLGHRRISGFGSFGVGDLGLTVLADHAARDAIDRDGDEVSEATGFTRTAITGLGHLSLGSRGELSLRLSGQQELRQGGGLGWGGSFLDVLSSPARGMTETAETHRIEAAAQFDWATGGGHQLQSSLAVTHHVQDSDYEGEVYVGRQTLVFAQQTAHLLLDPNYELVIGGAYRLEQLSENLAIREYAYHMPGVFAQGDWFLAEGLELIHGARLDWHSQFGEVLTPRLALKYAPLDWLTLRAVGGTGFRAPTTFYEYAHGVRPDGARYIMDGVEAERSVSGHLSAAVSTREFGLVVEGGLNLIRDPITWEVDDQGNIVVDNIAGDLRVLSLEVQADLQPLPWLTLRTGYGAYDYDDPQGALTSAAPVHQFDLSTDADIHAIGLEIIVSAQVFSPMDLVSVYGEGYAAQPGTSMTGYLDPAAADMGSRKRTRSPWYGVVDIALKQELTTGVSLLAGVDNLLDFHQADIESPLYFPAQSDGSPGDVDVIYVWGPLMGRLVYAGLQVEL